MYIAFSNLSCVTNLRSMNAKQCTSLGRVCCNSFSTSSTRCAVTMKRFARKNGERSLSRLKYLLEARRYG